MANFCYRLLETFFSLRFGTPSVKCACCDVVYDGANIPGPYAITRHLALGKGFHDLFCEVRRNLALAFKFKYAVDDG